MARLPSAKSKSHEVMLRGGPWSGKKAWLPVPNDGDPWSLPLSVQGYHGRYNLKNGNWSDLP